MAQVGGCLLCCLDLLQALFCSEPHKPGILLYHLVNGSEHYSQLWNLLPLKPEEAYQASCFILSSERYEMQEVDLYFREDVPACVRPPDP